MNNKKTSSLDLACEYISCICNELGPDWKCPLLNYGYPHRCPIDNKKDCKDNWKQYFQIQADIPDGWDVVKDLRQDINMLRFASNDNSNFCRREHKTPERYQGDWKSGQYYYQGKGQACAEIIDFIDDKLEHAGIEVSNEK